MVVAEERAAPAHLAEIPLDARSAAGPQLLRDYDDGAGWPNATREKELAFHKGFVEEARRIVRAWPGHDEQMHLQEAEERAAHQLRLRVRERYAVYGAAHGPGCAGRKTYHLGYRPGHEVPAARLRGRHHALAYVIQSWDETADSKMYERIILPAWLTAVERWAERPIRPDRTTPPPRPIEIEEAAPYLAEVAEAASRSDSQDANKPPADAPTAPPPSRLRLRLTRADQIEMRPPDWLLRGMLERDMLALIFGDPGSGKSFLAIDWACRVATGTPWRGHGVRVGPVLYIAGEGRQGFGRRVRAWQEHNGVSMDGAPLFVAPALAISDALQLADLVQVVEATAPAERPSLVVLDTLARCFGGGDENSTQDMSRFVSACDALRQRWGCTVLVVHHTGHADKSRARGAIALKAALDAEYRLTNNGGLLLSATKMKEAEMPPPLVMNLATVELPGLVDEYGNPVTSAAIEVLDADTSAIVSKVMAAKPGQRGKWQEVGLAVARRLLAQGDDGQASVTDWHAECEKAGMRQSTRYHVLAKLHAQGTVVVDGETLVTA